MLHLAGGGCGETTHQRRRNIKGVLNVGFALSDISCSALRHEGGKKAAGDAKLYVGGHWKSILERSSHRSSD